MNTEVWKDIEGFEGLYQISNLGNVKSFHYHNGTTERLLKLSLNTQGYFNVDLKKDNKRYISRIHRLVAKSFIPNPNELDVVNHINGIKTDNRVENLEWCTFSENSKHSYNTGLQKPKSGNRNGMYGLRGNDSPLKKSIIQFDKKGNIIQEYESVRDASLKTNIKHQNLTRCARGERRFASGFIWKYKSESEQCKQS